MTPSLPLRRHRSLVLAWPSFVIQASRKVAGARCPRGDLLSVRGTPLVNFPLFLRSFRISKPSLVDVNGSGCGQVGSRRRLPDTIRTHSRLQNTYILTVPYETRNLGASHMDGHACMLQWQATLSAFKSPEVLKMATLCWALKDVRPRDLGSTLADLYTKLENVKDTLEFVCTTRAIFIVFVTLALKAGECAWLQDSRFVACFRFVGQLEEHAMYTILESREFEAPVQPL